MCIPDKCPGFFLRLLYDFLLSINAKAPVKQICCWFVNNNVKCMGASKEPEKTS